MWQGSFKSLEVTLLACVFPQADGLLLPTLLPMTGAGPPGDAHTVWVIPRTRLTQRTARNAVGRNPALSGETTLESGAVSSCSSCLSH